MIKTRKDLRSYIEQDLKQNGVNVLAIADAPYESLSGQLKSTLREYYRVK